LEGDDSVWRPGAVFFEGHEFDEADDDAFFAGEFPERHDLTFVEAAQEHAIDFDRIKATAAGGANAGDDVVEAVGHARNAGEQVGLDGVKADGDAMQAGVLERPRQIRQQVAVGRESKVGRRSVGGAKLGQVANEVH